MGDFNTCLLKKDSRAQKLCSLVNSVNLDFLDLTPTHHSSSSDSLLDLILTCNPGLISTHGQLPAPAFSLHDLIYTSFKVKPPKHIPITLLQRSFAHMDPNKLCDDAAKINWLEIEELPTMDAKVDSFSSSIIQLFDQHAPVRPIKLRHAPCPWINDSVRKFMRARDRAFRKYKRDRTASNWDSYKRVRNRCNQLCRNAKRQYIAQQIECSSTAGLWKFLNSLGVGKSSVGDSKIAFDLDVLNSHFTTVPNYPSVLKIGTVEEIRKSPLPTCDPFTLSPVTCAMVKKMILASKTKAVGNDNIGRVMIMYILDLILPAITHIVNFSLSSGQFPDLWRSAFVLPIPKIQNPVLPNHYRPISILPFLSKIVESSVHSQLTSFLLRNNLFNPLQSGFRRGHSTTTALIKVTEDIRRGMEDSKVTILVLIDFSNAFNAVDHDLLIETIKRLNFSPIVEKWFSSYLINRRQAIRTSLKTSDWCAINAGVPQGGILSPLLFSLFINHLTPNFQSLYHLYADDLQLYQHTRVAEMADAIAILNDDLARLALWSMNYGISVNPSKCQAIVVGSSRQLAILNLSSCVPLSYNGSTIHFKSTVIDLGVVIDEKLSWSPQVDAVSRKVYSSLHYLSRLKNFLPVPTKISLATTLLLPIIDYADTCYVDLSEELLNKLERLQNCCIRFIFSLRKYDHVSKYRSQLKWLSIRQRRDLRVLCLLFSILFDPSTPQYLKTQFNFLSNLHVKELRSSHNLLLSTPSHHTSFLNKSFVVTAVRLWNALPIDVRKAPSIASFKRLVRESYLNVESSL